MLHRDTVRTAPSHAAFRGTLPASVPGLTVAIMLASTPPSILPGVAVPVDDQLAGIGFDGADAATFLHGQLSTDVIAMPVGAIGLGAYCSPKGRVLASLVLYRRAPDAFLALVAADLATALRKRLAMYVLRARVVVTDATAGKVIAGVGGEGSGEALARALPDAPPAGHGITTADGVVVALPDGRRLVIAEPAAAAALAERLGLPAAPSSTFALAGIRAGVPLVSQATQDLFVPQALNLDLLDGVNFRKGCYPGQEIVARMQYLGRLKERLFAFRVDAPPPAPGAPLFAAGAPGPALGTVVNAAMGDAGSEFLAVANYDAAVAGALRLGTPGGPVPAVLPLPYAIPVPVAPDRVKL